MADKSKHNALVKQCLKAYLKSSVSDTAMLLTGSWGCGKTYLVKQIIAELGDSPRCMYVSLNGVSSIDELTQAIVFALGAKTAWLGRLLGVAGRYLPDISGVPYKGLSGKVCRDASDKLFEKAVRDLHSGKFARPLIFDDIERCQMDIRVWSGYLMTIMESFRVPTLFIGNEARLLEDSAYVIGKEKFIGQTLVLEGDIDRVYPTLTADMELAPILCGGNMPELIKGVFHSFTDYWHQANYRAFKSALWQLNFWIQRGMLDSVNLNSPVAINVCLYFLALSYATLLGILTRETWSKKVPEEMPIPLCYNVISHGIDRHLFPDYYQSLLSLLGGEAVWRDWIIEGRVKLEAVRSALQRHDKVTPDGLDLRNLWLSDTPVLEQRLSMAQGYLDSGALVDVEYIRSAFEIKTFVSRMKYEAELDGEDGWTVVADHLYAEFCDYLNARYKEGRLNLHEDGACDSIGLRYDMTNCKGAAELYKRFKDYEQSLWVDNARKQLAHVIKNGKIAQVIDFLESRLYRELALLDSLSPTMVSRFMGMTVGATAEELNDLRFMFKNRYMDEVTNWRKFLGALSADRPVLGTMNTWCKERIVSLQNAHPLDYSRIHRMRLIVEALDSALEKFSILDAETQDGCPGSKA